MHKTKAHINIPLMPLLTSSVSNSCSCNQINLSLFRYFAACFLLNNIVVSIFNSCAQPQIMKIYTVQPFLLPNLVPVDLIICGF